MLARSRWTLRGYRLVRAQTAAHVHEAVTYGDRAVLGALLCVVEAQSEKITFVVGQCA